MKFKCKNEAASLDWRSAKEMEGFMSADMLSVKRKRAQALLPMLISSKSYLDTPLSHKSNTQTQADVHQHLAVFNTRMTTHLETRRSPQDRTRKHGVQQVRIDPCN